MSKRKPHDEKADHLKTEGTWNPRFGRVTDPVFLGSEFFDARDLVQVKYEMLRRARVDGRSVKTAAAAFGFSRPSFYEAQAALERGGLAGLLPRKRGPQRGHKLSEEILAFVEESKARDASTRSHDLARGVRERFGVSVHPRSIERALARRGKKRR
jgi:transposase